MSDGFPDMPMVKPPAAEEHGLLNEGGLVEYITGRFPGLLPDAAGAGAIPRHRTFLPRSFMPGCTATRLSGGNLNLAWRVGTPDAALFLKQSPPFIACFGASGCVRPPSLPRPRLLNARTQPCTAARAGAARTRRLRGDAGARGCCASAAPIPHNVARRRRLGTSWVRGCCRRSRGWIPSAWCWWRSFSRGGGRWMRGSSRMRPCWRRRRPRWARRWGGCTRRRTRRRRRRSGCRSWRRRLPTPRCASCSSATCGPCRTTRRRPQRRCGRTRPLWARLRRCARRTRPGPSTRAGWRCATATCTPAASWSTRRGRPR